LSEKGDYMSKEAIEQEINAQLGAKRKKVLNRNAISALFGAFSDPVGALGKIFIGRGDAIEAERQKIAQDLMLELLCKIDEAISQTAKQSAAQGVTLNGLIETTTQGVESVIGVHIAENSSAVTLQAGTHIRTSATGAQSVTGLKIGR